MLFLESGKMRSGENKTRRLKCLNLEIVKDNSEKRLVLRNFLHLCVDHSRLLFICILFFWCWHFSQDFTREQKEINNIMPVIAHISELFIWSLPFLWDAVWVRGWNLDRKSFIMSI